MPRRAGRGMSRRARYNSPWKRTGTSGGRNPRGRGSRRCHRAGGRSFCRRLRHHGRLRYHRRNRGCNRFRGRRRWNQGPASTLLNLFNRAGHRADFARMDLRTSDAGIHRVRWHVRRGGMRGGGVCGRTHRSVSGWMRRYRSGWMNRRGRRPLRRWMRRRSSGSRSRRSSKTCCLLHRHRRGRGRLRGYILRLRRRRSLDLSWSRYLCNAFLPGVGAEIRPHLFRLIVIQRT